MFFYPVRIHASTKPANMIEEIYAKGWLDGSMQNVTQPTLKGSGSLTEQLTGGSGGPGKEYG